MIKGGSMKKLVLLLALTACSPDVPTWQNNCVKSHTIMVPMPTVIGKSTIITMQPRVVCDEREWQCYIPEDWEKSPTCPTLGLQGEE